MDPSKAVSILVILMVTGSLLLTTSKEDRWSNLQDIDAGPASDLHRSSGTVNSSALLYSTYLGGNGRDTVTGICLDDDGAVYIIGYTDSTDFETSDGAYQRSNRGFNDVFIVKVSPIDTLVYSTLVGGSGWDGAFGIAVDRFGNAYIAGHTNSTDFPTVRPYQDSKAENIWSTGFVVKLGPNGTRLDYSTYLGGTGRDNCGQISVDEDGQAYVSGLTNSTDFPTTDGCYKKNISGVDGFVTKFSADGGSLLFSTFIGGPDVDYGGRLALGDNGGIYLTGSTNGSEFPTTPGAYQTGSDVSGTSIFVVKLSADGTSLEYATYLGTSDLDAVTDIVVDERGCVHIVGYTNSDDFPTTIDAYQRTGAEGLDLFITKFAPDAKSLEYSTLFAEDGDKYPSGISLDPQGNTYVSGTSWNGPVPTTDHAYQSKANGHSDAFILKLSPDGSQNLYSSLFGGSEYDRSSGCAVDHFGNLFVVGDTWSDDLPTTKDAYQKNHSETYLYDGYFFQMRTDHIPPVADAGYDMIVNQGDTVTLNGTGSWDETLLGKWEWTLSHVGANVTLRGPMPQFTFEEWGTHKVTLNLTDTSGNWATDEVNVTVRDVTPPIADAGQNFEVDQGKTFHFDGSGSSDNIQIANMTWTFTYRGEEVWLFGKAPMFTFDDVEVVAVQLIVTDQDGNIAMSFVNVSVLDAQEPTMVEDLSDTGATTGDDLWFRVNVTDNIGVAGVVLDLNGESVNMSAETLYGYGKGIYRHRITVANERTDPIGYRFIIRDLQGNVGLSPWVPIDVLDNDAPSVISWTPSKGVKGLPFHMYAQADDNVDVSSVRVEYWFEDGVHKNITMDDIPYIKGPNRIPVGSHMCHVGIPRDAIGPLTYFMTAEDVSGNAMSTDEREVWLYNTPPNTRDPGYWNVTEEVHDTLDLSDYIWDANDGQQNLSINVLSDEGWMEGMVLHVLYEEWQPDDTIWLDIDDGEDSTFFNISVRMTNVNDAPVILDIEPETGSAYYEGDPVPFRAICEDEDHDPLTYTWREGAITLHVGEAFNTIYLGPGKHIITLFVQDGEVVVSQDVTVEVFAIPDEPDEPETDIFGLWSMVVIVAIMTILVVVGVLVNASRGNVGD